MELEKIVKESLDKRVTQEEENTPIVDNSSQEINIQDNLPEQPKETKELAEQPKNGGQIAVKQLEKTISEITNSFTPDASKSVNEQAKEAVDVLTVAEAVKDKGTVEELTKHKKEELVSRAEANAKEEKAKSKGSEITLQKAEFGIYEGIASYAGIKKSLPQKMQKILMVPLQIIVGVLLFLFGSIASAINVVLDCINAIMIRFSDLTEASKKAVKNIGIALAIAIVLVGLYFGIKAILQHYGIWFNFNI